MRMLNLDRRVQLMLDEARYRRIAQEAARRQVSVASVIREAIDRLPEQAARRRDAIAQILAAEAMPVPDDPAELRREIDGEHESPPGTIPPIP